MLLATWQLTAGTFHLPLPLGLDWTHGHAVLALFGFLLPLGMSLQLRLLRTLTGRTVAAGRTRIMAILWGLGTLVAAVSAFRFQDLGLDLFYRLGFLILFGAAGFWTGTMLKALPKKRDKMADVTRDPLTKGDDACYTQLRFAHFFLALAILLLAYAGPWWAIPADSIQHGAFLAGLHLLLAGYALVSFYGISHLAVPRLSGVPAIAAGAIKGELHSTLLGLVGLVAGFLLSPRFPGVGRGLVTGLGFFVFVGAFTFMGVLGANIMKNKSRTQRVTRDFVYVPWVFAGVFWLMSGILAGMLLPAAACAQSGTCGTGLASGANHLPIPLAGLRFFHVHSTILGGFTMLALGLLSRLVPMAANLQPPSFGSLKLPFYGLNAALLLLVWGELATTGWVSVAGSLLAILALAVWFIVLGTHGLRRDHGDR